ncbi:MAG: hypothetical protein ISR78_07030 [Spirochaetia bacterium]|nr:hypothetical protein [Spirochaetia bacterium]
MSARKLTTLLLASLVFLYLSTGCATSFYTGDRYHDNSSLSSIQDVPDGSAFPLFFGYGEGSSDKLAIQAAEQDAVARLVLAALGDEALLMQSGVYTAAESILNIDSFILPGSLEIIERDYDTGIYKRLVQVRIDAGLSAKYFTDRGISGGLLDGITILRLADAEMPVYNPSDPIDHILENSAFNWDGGWEPTFLVYYDEEQDTKAFPARTAVLTAADYLSSLGFRYVDLSQIERIKLDQEYAFAEEQGYSSMIRWVASKLNADYYIDTAVTVSSYYEKGNYYAAASISVNCFSASTGAGRGTAFYHSADSVQGKTSQAAEDKAVSIAMIQAMTDLMKKSSKYFVEDAEIGSEYELILMKTPLDKAMRELLKALQVSVSEIRRTTFSVEETRFSIRFNGRMEDLEEAIYQAAESVAGLEDMYLVYQRGNSFTFNTGK